MSSLVAPKKGQGAAMLQELNAEIAERTKQDEQAAPPSPELEAVETNDAHLRKYADAQALAQVSEEVSTPASKQVRTQAPKRAPKQVSKPARKQALEEVSAGAPEQALEEIVRERLAARPRYEGGTKASVEMPTEDSLRIKRYLLDHGGGTTRDLLLTLVLAFLEKEGY